MNMEDRVPETKEAQIRQEIEEIVQGLHELETGANNVMAERIFVQVFLPLFAGEPLISPKVCMAMWANKAGSPYRPVDVVDGAGKLLFTVPAIMDRSAVNPAANVRGGIMHVIATASQLRQISPQDSDAYVDSELGSRAMMMQSTPGLMENVKTWNAIMLRYGRKPLVDLELPDDPKAAATDTKGSKSNEDYSEWEML